MKRTIVFEPKAYVGSPQFYVLLGMENALLYLAYGSKDIINQTVYSILSLYKHRSIPENQLKVYIYTDNAAAFSPALDELPVVFYPIDSKQIDEWKGDIQFFFRAKIKLIQDFFSKHPSANLLYLDSDTYFQKDISSIFTSIAEGQYFMHEYEGVYDQQHPDRRKFSTAKAIDRILKSQSFVGTKGDTFTIHPQTQLWNAGVMGLHPSIFSVLDDVVLLTEQLYRLKDAHTMEQFSFSYFLQKMGPLKDLRQEILHYWNFKEFNGPLAAFFDFHNRKSTSELIEVLDQINPVHLIQPKRNYLSMPFFIKNYHKIFKGKWRMPVYTLT